MSEVPETVEDAPVPTAPTADPSLQRITALAQAALVTAQQAQQTVASAQATDPAKPWYKSKGVLGSVVAGSLASLTPAVLEASRADPKTQLITLGAMAFATTIASMFGLVGRATASQPVK